MDATSKAQALSRQVSDFDALVDANEASLPASLVEGWRRTSNAWRDSTTADDEAIVDAWSARVTRAVNAFRGQSMTFSGAASPTAQAVPRTYDPLFYAIGKQTDLPPALFKTISWHESRFEAAARPKPTAANPRPQATGFGQITSDVLQSFNKATGAGYTEDRDMIDPSKNLEAQAYLLTLISATLTRNTKLKEDWSDSRWVGLVLLGYVAGYSAKQGVAGLVKYLESQGIPDEKIVPANVVKIAGVLFPNSRVYVAKDLRDADGTGPYMSDPALLADVQSRLNDYLRFKVEGMLLPPETKEPVAVTVIDPPQETPWGVISAIASLLGLVLAWFESRARTRELTSGDES